MASPLFSEIVVGRLRLRNRLAFLATIGNLGRDGLPTEAQEAYYERRARGGVGMIVTEGVSVHRSSQPNANVVQAYNPKAHRGLKKIAKASHKHGVPLFLQLWHVGRQQLWGPTRSPWGVSELPDAYSGVVPHVMTVAEIEEIERAFIDCAKVAEELGFDGVEIHGAHGYLVTQFLSPWSNTRTDDYGGSRDGRMRFLVNVLEGIRKECGRELAISLKLSGAEFVRGGLRPADTRDIIEILTTGGLVDVVAINQGNFSLSLERHVPDMHFPQAPFVGVVAQTRPRSARVPVMAIGRIIEREVAERLLTDGTAEMIGMARALISDPDLPRLWAAGDDAHVRRCISCNLCWGTIHAGKAIVCIHNAQTGNELSFKAPKRTKAPRAVHVIGGGPAGLEAAWVAASRGCDVHLWEAANELGGQVRALAQFPGLAEYGWVLDYQRARLAEHGVTIHLGHAVRHAELRGWCDAAIVVATGSAPQRAPEVLRRFSPSAPEDILGVAKAPGAHAIVFDEDGGYAAYGPVDLLVSRGYFVTLATSRMEIGSALDYVSKIGLQRRLREGDVEILTGVEPIATDGESLVLADRYSRREMQLPRPDVVVWAGARAARDDLTRGGLDVTVIGDAVSPRRIISAVHEGFNAGRSL